VTTVETLRAAADVLSANPSPLNTAVANLLDDTAGSADTRIRIWQETEQDVDGLTECHFGLALAVARAALTEVAV
jgi:hypothetical protein